ncbi:MAG: alkane 1-monooxygenase [Actinobacteria bacterium]|nr:alkane 1-monooxygenase [Actinomycetota bacterium]
MNLGLFAMPLHPPGSNLSETLRHDLNQIIKLDELGYKEAWIGEHFTGEWENIPAPDLFIAHALGKTENIVLGTGVSCLPNHNPFVLAHRIAQLDQMAEGRFQWGIGAGGFPGDLTAFGYGDDRNNIQGRDNRKMAQEAVKAILEIWDNPEPGVRKNEFWEYYIPDPDPDISLRVHVKPFQLPHPPIGVAGVSESSRTIALAGEKGWIPLSINLVPTRILESHWEAISEGAQKGNLVPDRSKWRIARDIFVADTDEEAITEATKGVLARDFNGYIHPLLKKTNMFGAAKVDPNISDEEVTVEYMIENIWLVGDPETVAEKIVKIYKDVGGFGYLLAMAHDWDPWDKWEKSFNILINEVIPIVNKELNNFIEN